MDVKVKCQNISSACLIEDVVQFNDGDNLDITNLKEFQDTEILFIKPNVTISFLPQQIFRTFPRLSFVKLSTGVKAIDKESLKGATHLKHLNLEYNKLKSISREVFSEPSRLIELVLSYNEITEIEDFAFHGLDFLGVLKLSNNHLSIVKKDTFTGSANIFYLALNNNEIEMIEDSAFNLPRLIFLFLSGNRIRHLADNVFRGASHLTLVDFARNNATHIGQAFYNSVSVTTIFLDNNQIKDVNLTAFAQLPQLGTLSLRNNNFKFSSKLKVQADFKSPLTLLELSENGLSKADILEDLAMFGNLQELYLNNNSFTYIKGFTDIKKKFPKINKMLLKNNNLNCDWTNKNIEQLRLLGNDIPPKLEMSDNEC